MGLLSLPEPPQEAEFKSLPWVRWFTALQEGLTSNKPLAVPTYLLASLPSAASYSGKYIDVSDATGGAKLCRSDGTDWKIANTTTTVS